MKLNEKVEALETLGKVVVHHRSGRFVNEFCLSPWYATIDDLEIGNGIILKSEFGDGDTPNEAIEELFELLTSPDMFMKNEVIVMRAAHDSRAHYLWSPLAKAFVLARKPVRV